MRADRAEVVGRSSVGGRTENQDAWRSGDGPEHTVVILADGAGGHNGGAIASRLAADTLLAALLASPEVDLGQAIQGANDAIVAEQQAEPAFSRMRTTVVALVLSRDTARWAHLGDSRLYHLRGHRVRSRTLDDSLPEVLLGQGELAHEDELRHHPDRSRLLRALGKAGPTKATVSEPVRLQGADRLVLCSDGVWECFDRAELEAMSARSAGPGDLAEALLALARERGGDTGDNATVVVVEQPGAPAAQGEGDQTQVKAVGWLLGLLALVAVGVFVGGAGLVGYALWTRSTGPEAPAVSEALGATELHAGPGQTYTLASEALAASQPGDTLVLHGTEGAPFLGPLVVRHALNIRSASGYQAVIQGTEGGPAVVVQAPGVVLTDLNLWSVPEQASLVVAEGGGASVSEVVAGGLEVEAGGKAELSLVKLMDRGLRVDGTVSISVLGVTDAAGIGVELGEGASLDGEGLTITEATGWGLVAGPDSSVSLHRLVIEGSGEGGLQLTAGSLVLEQGVVEANRGPGMVLERAQAELHTLTIAGNQGVGLDTSCSDLIENAVVITGNRPDRRTPPCEAEVEPDDNGPPGATEGGEAPGAPRGRTQPSGKNRKAGKHKAHRSPQARPQESP